MTHTHTYETIGGKEVCFECDHVKDATAPARVARDKVRKLNAGLVRVNVWVPADKRETLLTYAEKLRRA